eukprot:CAMPEP_0113626534 /NCGR_PEP_ID=MMETSP0017_2-20120614/13722_1 /TAXON_ID=2856 /ORGANISM="Cylindrotheca closterium" /LENGTH=523 /DNA_ID=CAMNT_0000536717 /DNA_START=368 /DNA_END=1939 /DNA_ORIENTATION=+ /assembly_acc=CAM_ASM_000147
MVDIVTSVKVTDLDGKKYKHNHADFDDTAIMNLLNRVKKLHVDRYGSDSDDNDQERHFVGDLVKFLDMTTRRIEEIEIYENYSVIPEYLAFLTKAFCKADHVNIDDSLICDAAFACVAAGLTHKEGARELSLNLQYEESSISAHQAQVLSQGIALSPSLHHLKIVSSEYDPHMAAPIADAVRQSTILKSFSITWPWEDSDPSWMLQSTLASRPNLETLTVQSWSAQEVSLDILRNGVCRLDCSLQEINLEKLTFTAADEDECSTKEDDDGCSMIEDAPNLDSSMTPMPPNKSVKTLCLFHSWQPLPQVMKVVQMFQKLVHLDISGGCFTDLVALDDLLLSEKSSLERLSMYHCGIEAHPMEAFARKLPRMKRLKVLVLGDNPFQESPSCVRALKDSLWRNHSLEIVHLGGKFPKIIASRLDQTLLADPHFGGHCSHDSKSEGTPLTNQEMLPLHLNRAGRGSLLQMEQLSHDHLPLNLLPLILERAWRLQYCTHCGIDADQTVEDRRRKEVVFWLLRNLILIA